MATGIMDPSSMVNHEMVQIALDIATPPIMRLMGVQEPAMVWGPKYLVVVVLHPALKNPVARKIGTTESWKTEWGKPEDCEKIANWKAEAAQREGKPTSELTLMYPWDHEPGDYLYAGGVADGKLAVGSSGFVGFADEIASNIVLALIKGFCKTKREQLRENKVRQIGLTYL